MELVRNQNLFTLLHSLDSLLYLAACKKWNILRIFHLQRSASALLEWMNELQTANDPATSNPMLAERLHYVLRQVLHIDKIDRKSVVLGKEGVSTCRSRWSRHD